VWWHRGRCLSYGNGAAFWALSEAVRGRLGLVESDSGAIVGERLDEWIADRVADGAERDWLRPRVSALLGETSTATFTREELADMTGMQGEGNLATGLDMEIAHAMADGDAQRAAALADECLPHLLAAMSIDDDFVTVWPPLVEAALAAGDVAIAERLLAPVEDAPASLVSPGVRAHWLRLRGRLGALRGDDPQTVEGDLRAGIVELDAYGAVGYRGRAQEELGRWLLSQGRGTEAAPLLEAARATYEEIGAAGWLARLDAARATVPSADR
jgi:hypothetical protein